MWKAFCQAPSATSILTFRYHLQSNGQTERCNQELEAPLRYIINNNPSTWSQHLTWIVYSITPKYPQQWINLLLRLHSAIPLHCFLQKRLLFVFFLFSTKSAVTAEFGAKPRRLSSRQLNKIRGLPTDTKLQLQINRSDRRYGFPPKTLPSRTHPENLPSDSFVHFPYLKLSILLLYINSSFRP